MGPDSALLENILKISVMVWWRYLDWRHWRQIFCAMRLGRLACGSDGQAHQLTREANRACVEEIGNLRQTSSGLRIILGTMLYVIWAVLGEFKEVKI